MGRYQVSPVMLLMAMMVAIAWPASAVDSPVPKVNGGLTIGGVSIEGIFEQGKPGPYSNFYEDLTASSPVPTNLVILSTKRMTRAFFGRETDCYYLANDDAIYYQQHNHQLSDFYFSRPFNRIYMRAYTRSADPVLRDWAALDGKTIAGDEGLHLSSIAQRRLPFAKLILYAKNVDEAFDVVLNGRAQVVLAYSIDAAQYFQHVGKRDFHADEKFSLITLTESFICWPSETARQFIEHADKTIAALAASGELKRKYGFSQ